MGRGVSQGPSAVLPNRRRSGHGVSTMHFESSLDATAITIMNVDKEMYYLNESEPGTGSVAQVSASAAVWVALLVIRLGRVW